MTVRYTFIEGQRYFDMSMPHQFLPNAMGSLDWQEAAQRFHRINRDFIVEEKELVLPDGRAARRFELAPRPIDRYPVKARQRELPSRPSEWSRPPTWNFVPRQAEDEAQLMRLRAPDAHVPERPAAEEKAAVPLARAA